MTNNNSTTPYTVLLHTKSLTALPGYRLATISWKETTDKITKIKNKAHSAVSVMMSPIELLITSPTQLVTALQEACANMQDARLRDYLNEKLDSGTNIINLSIPANLFTAAEIAAYQAETTTSGRLNGEAIKAWFDDMLTEPLTVAFIEKQPDLSADAITKLLSGYEATFRKLASPTNIPLQILGQLEKAINLIPADTYEANPTAQKLTTQLISAITKRKPVDEDTMLAML